MGEIILARLVSGQLIIAEKTGDVIEYPVLVALGQRGLLIDFHSGLSKNGRADSRKIELSNDLIMPGTEAKPIEEMKNKYVEMKTGITVPKKKIIQTP